MLLVWDCGKLVCLGMRLRAPSLRMMLGTSFGCDAECS